MAESVIRLCERMEVLKQKMATVSCRLTKMESSRFLSLMQEQIDVMNDTISVFYMGARDVSREEDDRMLENHRAQWNGKRVELPK